MDAFRRIAEERIRKGIEEGAFKNLSNNGKPLNLQDDIGVPEELRMAYKILKNAKVLPPEMEIRKEILSLQDLIDVATDEVAAAKYRRRLQAKQLQFEMAMERHGKHLPIKYRSAAFEKMGQSS